PEELVGDLDQDAGPVAGVDLHAGGAAVLEVTERADAHLDDVVGGRALDVDDERDAAGVVFESGVVQPALVRTVRSTVLVRRVVRTQGGRYGHVSPRERWMPLAGTTLARC